MTLPSAMRNGFFACGEKENTEMKMNSRYTLRRADEQDVPKIAEIEALIFSDAWSTGAIRETLASPCSHASVVTDPQGRIAAYCLGTRIPPEGEILRIATLPEHRRQGLAQALLADAAEGLDCLYLEVRAQNLPALSLYRSFGFTENGRRERYYQNPTDDAILLGFSPSSPKTETKDEP